MPGYMEIFILVLKLLPIRGRRLLTAGSASVGYRNVVSISEHNIMSMIERLAKAVRPTTSESFGSQDQAHSRHRDHHLSHREPQAGLFHPYGLLPSLVAIS